MVVTSDQKIQLFVTSFRMSSGGKGKLVLTLYDKNSQQGCEDCQETSMDSIV